MKRNFVIKASEEAKVRRNAKAEVKASNSTSDMLAAFEDKLYEMGIESSTEVKANDDYDDAVCEEGMIYEDPEGSWEIVSINGDEVEVKEVDTGREAVVPISEVKYFCKYGLGPYPYRSVESSIEDKDEIEATEYPAWLNDQVDVYGEDYNEKYEDVEGVFGEPGDIYSLADIKAYWNEEREDDPVLQDFRTFDDWFRNTKDNFLTEA